MDESFFGKDDPAINEHHYHITKKQYNGETHNIYNIDKTKTYNIKNNRYTDDYYYNKTRNINNNIINNISKQTFYLIMNMYEVLKNIISLKTISATTINHRLLMLNIIYKKAMIRLNRGPRSSGFGV